MEERSLNDEYGQCYPIFERIGTPPSKDDSDYLLKRMIWSKKYRLFLIEHDLSRCLIYEIAFPYKRLPKDPFPTDNWIQEFHCAAALSYLTDQSRKLQDQEINEAHKQKSYWKRKNDQVQMFKKLDREINSLIDEYNEAQINPLEYSDKLAEMETRFCNLLYETGRYVGAWSAKKKRAWGANNGGETRKKKAEKSREEDLSMLKSKGFDPSTPKGKRNARLFLLNDRKVSLSTANSILKEWIEDVNA